MHALVKTGFSLPHSCAPCQRCFDILESPSVCLENLCAMIAGPWNDACFIVSMIPCHEGQVNSALHCLEHCAIPLDSREHMPCAQKHLGHWKAAEVPTCAQRAFDPDTLLALCKSNRLVPVSAFHTGQLVSLGYCCLSKASARRTRAYRKHEAGSKALEAGQ